VRAQVCARRDCARRAAGSGRPRRARGADRIAGVRVRNACRQERNRVRVDAREPENRGGGARRDARIKKSNDAGRATYNFSKLAGGGALVRRSGTPRDARLAGTHREGARTDARSGGRTRQGSGDLRLRGAEYAARLFADGLRSKLFAFGGEGSAWRGRRLRLSSAASRG